MSVGPVRFTSHPAKEGCPVELRMDPGQPTPGTLGSMQPSRPWMLGLVAVDDDPLARPGARPYSYRAECECPDDCPRDHDNE